MKKFIFLFILFWLSIAPVIGAPKAFNWQNESNSALLTETGDFTNAWWWWFRPDKRPVSNPYLLLNHKSNSWSPTYDGCAFNPNGNSGKKYTVTKNGVEYEYYLFEKVVLVAPVQVGGGKVIAQTKGNRITGGLGICGVRYFPYAVPIKIALP